MTPVTYTELRQNLARWMDHAVEQRDPVLVTRQGAKPVVMVSLEEWEGWMETLHLLSNPRNAESLMRSMADANAGRFEKSFGSMEELEAAVQHVTKPAPDTSER
ncbi:MAG TPA: type II toxin-antitoxin system Phd/YefM family antitoxin [Acetobacteraceae bacterium]|nr:type II toxin-antitoxin system Phd/YefM family antitoxin [Acetobacteraceae bacterium]